MEYNEEDYLQISGLQHFLFCRRQWALIHVEQQWTENYLTTDGEIMHENAHNPDNYEKRKDIIIYRGMRVSSSTLGLSGECDVVEFHKLSSGGIRLNKHEGLWQPYPVEYKRGKEKSDKSDEVQLCAQAMCLEEMFCCHVPKGSLYYGKTRHRMDVVFVDELRNLVIESSNCMHSYMSRGYTPKPAKNASCNSCSLKDICLPSTASIESVKSYIARSLRDISV